VVGNPKLYTESAWTGIALDEATKTLLTQGGLTPEQQAQLNLALLRAAYPGIIAGATPNQ